MIILALVSTVSGQPVPEVEIGDKINPGGRFEDVKNHDGNGDEDHENRRKKKGPRDFAHTPATFEEDVIDSLTPIFSDYAYTVEPYEVQRQCEADVQEVIWRNARLPETLAESLPLLRRQCSRDLPWHLRQDVFNVRVA